MKQQHSLAAIVAIAALSLTACQKAYTPAIALPLTQASLAGTYRVTGMVLQADAGTSTDLFATLADCQQQEQQVLLATGEYRLTNACDPAGNRTSTWTLHNPQFITINGLTGRLVSFSNNRLVLSFENFLGMPGTLTETLTRQ